MTAETGRNAAQADLEASQDRSTDRTLDLVSEQDVERYLLHDERLTGEEAAWIAQARDEAPPLTPEQQAALGRVLGVRLVAR